APFSSSPASCDSGSNLGGEGVDGGAGCATASAGGASSGSMEGSEGQSSGSDTTSFSQGTDDELGVIGYPLQARSFASAASAAPDPLAAEDYEPEPSTQQPSKSRRKAGRSRAGPPPDKAAAAAAAAAGGGGAAAVGGPATPPSPPPPPSALSPQAYRQLHGIQIKATGGGQVPDPVLALDDTGFPAPVLKAMKAAGYTVPSPIQAQGWPVLMQGSDIIAIASTGSGKTAGFLLPALAHVSSGRLSSVLTNAPAEAAPSRGPVQPRTYMQRSGSAFQAATPQVLVLAPTRELAQQIAVQAEKYSKGLPVNTTVVYGGASKLDQVRSMRYKKPDVLVATPGRLLDLAEEGQVDISNVAYLVLDEADRMLDMGFEDEIVRILDMTPKSQARQTAFFSATWPKEVRALAQRLSGPQPVTLFIGDVGAQAVAAKTIRQEVAVLQKQQDKMQALFDYLTRCQPPPGSKDVARVLIFVSTKMDCEEVAAALQNGNGLPRARAIHGGLTQASRERALDSFRTGFTPILVATDVAARGLDVPNVTAVVNFDCPRESQAEDYVHRIGRTGRAGASGKALALLVRTNKEDCCFARRLVKIMGEAGQPVPAELLQMAQTAGVSQGGMRRGSGNRRAAPHADHYSSRGGSSGYGSSHGGGHGSHGSFSRTSDSGGSWGSGSSGGSWRGHGGGASHAGRGWEGRAGSNTGYKGGRSSQRQNNDYDDL
ncbi:hypothetical protein QJQ45_023347, partial [Haematococcus lacustris]